MSAESGSRSSTPADDGEGYRLDGEPLSYVLDDGDGNRRSRSVYRWRPTEAGSVALGCGPEDETAAATLPDCAARQLRDNLARKPGKYTQIIA
jgi:hypothetical protein